MVDNSVLTRHGTPPDDHRCIRNDGKTWRCKQRRGHGMLYCQKHFYLNCKKNGKKTMLQVQIQEEDQYLGVTKRRRVYGDKHNFYCCSIRDENYSSPMKLHKGSEREESEEEEDYISDLLLPLKTSPGEKEFETVEEILKMREEKLRMEKEESKKHVIHLVEDLGVYHSRCNELWNELERKKREISRVEGKLEVAYGREQVFEERITDLECAKTRAESEIEFWKKMFKQLETRVLVEPQVLRNLYVEPRDEEGLNGRESVVRGETVSGVMVKIKEEAMNYGGRGYGYMGVDSPSTKQIGMPELAGSSNNQHCVY